jgi:TPR repeat protein
MYYSGRGVPQDNVMAYMWFDLAATQGKEYAASNRERLRPVSGPIPGPLRNIRALHEMPKRAGGDSARHAERSRSLPGARDQSDGISEQQQ